MMETNAAPGCARGGGRWSNISISGKLMSTCGRPVLRRRSSSSGRRCSVCGPNTTSTYGARCTMAAPSWLATQPPTAIMREGFARFSRFTRPRSAKTFSCAFSRTEQVLKTITSASSGHDAASWPSAARSTSPIFCESYSFIWQPKVRTKTLPTAASALVRLRGFLRREQPDLAHHAVGIHDILGERSLGDRARHDDEIRRVADLRSGRELALRAVDGDGHAAHVPHLAARRIGRNRAQLAERGSCGERKEDDGGVSGKGHGKKWWRIRDSNPGHTDYDSA